MFIQENPAVFDDLLHQVPSLGAVGVEKSMRAVEGPASKPEKWPAPTWMSAMLQQLKIRNLKIYNLEACHQLRGTQEK
jgi:hypothetical protein